MDAVKPGTYRITNVGGGTSIYARDNNWDTGCWAKSDNKNQQWYLQSSGAGYRIKNCRNGLYLLVTETKDCARIFCGRYPTTWELSQGTRDHNQYMIKLANNKGFAMDLRNWGASHDGNEVDLCPVRDWLDCQKWRFERLSDDTGEEDQKLRNDITAKNKQLEDLKSQLTKKDAQVTQLTQRLSSQSQELETLRKANESLRNQSVISLSTKLQNTNKHFEKDMNQQKEETSSLRESLSNLEKRFAQMMEQNVRPRNNTS
ncbi:ricin-type beta-trefoil lectin domain protein [Ceratobasidium sp. AG-Ba]|nr:ricin-type beta-trefoil lectin domain protein [Ceratobasidium sp. AG-Ba]